jgi:hypothetical protein
MEIKTDRVGLLTEQLRESMQFSQMRMEGLSDAEYLWEPVPGMWSIRRRGQTVTSGAYGPGEWQLDTEHIDPFAAGPPTTIAWRLNHVLSGVVGRWEWTFGNRSTPPADVVDFSPDPTVTLDALWDIVGRWATDIEALDDPALDEPGYGQYPWGLDPELPFIGIVRWVNREFIHHLAEAALLRDLYAAVPDRRSGSGIDFP